MATPTASAKPPGTVESGDEADEVVIPPSSTPGGKRASPHQAWSTSTPVTPKLELPPLSGEDATLCDSIIADLDGVACDWDKVLDVFEKHPSSDEVMERVIMKSSEAMGFWAPDAEFLAQSRRVVRHQLAEKSLGKVKSFTKPGADSGDESIEEVKPPGWDRQISKQSEGKGKDLRGYTKTSTATSASTHLFRGGSVGFTRAASETAVAEDVAARAKELSKQEKLLIPNSAASRLRQFKWALFFFVTMQMVMFACYVVFYMTPKTWDVIGLPILIARGSAYGACFWTALLFLTMSRDLISFMARIPFIKNSQLMMQLINCHKEIHIFSAWEVLLDGFLHALMHHIGTFVALEKEDTKTLNDMLVCAQEKKNIPDGYVGKDIGNFLKRLSWPVCPIPEDADVGYFDGVLSTPGITGYLLLITICVLGWFSRQKKRRANFRRFYALHHLLVPSWVILLVLHGANDWVGLGFPLVILVSGIPVAAYLWTRLRRMYLTCRHDAKVLSADKSVTGKLLRIELELMPTYRQCLVGEYAYINVPDIGWTEWHPYTISDSKELADGRQVITFCIMAVGKWTQKLHTLFDSALSKQAQGSSAWPRVYIDGPFYAPTVSMPNRSTVVGIGAGVGVTPFLSFLGSMVRTKRSEHRNAHVFWMSAFATDFLLFRDMFSSLDRQSNNGGANTTFHLHATPRFGAWNGKGLGSVFELCAREVWVGWQQRLAAKEKDLVPTFCKYKNPLHAFVTRNMLDSHRPLAVAVGSPDWITEFLAIGEADLSEDVFVYFCGNDFLKNMIQTACIACNEHRAMREQGQRYYFYFERFG